MRLLTKQLRRFQIEIAYKITSEAPKLRSLTKHSKRLQVEIAYKTTQKTPTSHRIAPNWPTKKVSTHPKSNNQ